MRSSVLLLLVGMAALASAQKLPLPRLTDEERKLFLSDMDQVVDCLIEPKNGCHPYTEDVRRVLPDLVKNRFRCNCDAQEDVNRFRLELNRGKNNRAFRKLSLWVNKELTRR